MAITRYVNLPENSKKKHGKIVLLKTKASNLTLDDVERAEWWIEPKGSNQDTAKQSRFQRCRLRWQYTRNIDNYFLNYLYLPHVGGDEYTVRVSKRGDRSKTRKWSVKTWRKIYYTVYLMTNECNQIFEACKGRFHDAFKDGFIELDLVAKKPTRKDGNPIVEDHTSSETSALVHLYDQTPRLSDHPHHLRLVVVNNVYEPTANIKKAEVDFADVVWTINKLVPNEPVKWVYAKPEDSAGWYNITEFAEVEGDDKVKLPLDKEPNLKKALAAGKKVKIVIRVFTRGEYCGHSIGNFCCTRIKESGTPAQIQTTILQTLTHEIGHSLQQTVRFEAQYDGEGNPTGLGWNNSKWHTNNYGGQGDHCSTNAVLAPCKIPDPANPGEFIWKNSPTSTGQYYQHSGGTLCTMYFKAHNAVDAAGKFCAKCDGMLTRVDLGAEKMLQERWGKY